MTFVFNACDWVVTSFPIIQQWVPVMTGKAERPKLLCNIVVNLVALIWCGYSGSRNTWKMRVRDIHQSGGGSG